MPAMKENEITRNIIYTLPCCCLLSLNNNKAIERGREKKRDERSQSIPSLELALQGGDIILYPWFRAGIGDISFFIPGLRYIPRSGGISSSIPFLELVLQEGDISFFIFFSWYRLGKMEGARFPRSPPCWE